jgi:hypothetical protein
MTMRTSILLLSSLVLALVGCTTNNPPATDAGPGNDAGGTDDTGGGGNDTGPPVDAWMSIVHDGGYDDAGPAMAFTAPMETWTGVTIEGSHCGNGSPLVVAVNLTNRSTDVVMYFQGGGACWDAATCFILGTAAHIQDTLTPAQVVDEAMRGTSFLFERNAQNPWQNANYVYVPYCTGDAHSGANVATFTTSSGPREVHFEGAHNTELVLARMAATFTTTTHMTLIGASAGGYGVASNWWRAQGFFPSARVDALDDSGLPVDPPDARWHTMLTAWGFDLPPDCACSTISGVLPYYQMTMTPPHRFGLLAYLDDTTIPGFYGSTTAQVHAGLVALEPTFAATPNMRYFYVNAPGHVLLSDPTLTAGASGPTVRAWATQFATDDPAWDSVGP